MKTTTWMHVEVITSKSGNLTEATLQESHKDWETEGVIRGELGPERSKPTPDGPVLHPELKILLPPDFEVELGDRFNVTIESVR